MKYIKHLPNFLTLLNLLLGCIAAISAIQSSQILELRDLIRYQVEVKPTPADFTKLYLTGFIVIIAASIDFADGFIARFVKSESRFGKYLDSLADMVTFGMVPGIIAYKLIGYAIAEDNSALNTSTAPFYIGFMLTLFAAIRLARYNTEETKQQDFLGLPTPAMAIFIASLPMAIAVDEWGIRKWLLNQYVLYITIAVVCLLMVSRLPMLSLKFEHFQWKGNETRYVFTGMTVLLLISFYLKLSIYLTPPLIIIIYILLSLGSNIIQKKRIPQ